MAIRLLSQMQLLLSPNNLTIVSFQCIPPNLSTTFFFSNFPFQFQEMIHKSQNVIGVLFLFQLPNIYLQAAVFLVLTGRRSLGSQPTAPSTSSRRSLLTAAISRLSELSFTTETSLFSRCYAMDTISKLMPTTKT